MKSLNLEAIKALLEKLSPEQIQKLGIFSLFALGMLKGLEIMLASSNQEHA